MSIYLSDGLVGQFKARQGYPYKGQGSGGRIGPSSAAVPRLG